MQCSCNCGYALSERQALTGMRMIVSGCNEEDGKFYGYNIYVVLFFRITLFFFFCHFFERLLLPLILRINQKTLLSKRGISLSVLFIRSLVYL